MRLTIGISPCPNDTYIFEALAQKIISIPNITLDFEYHDIAILNKKAQLKELDIVKISYANYFKVAKDYILLRSGGAMGFGVGPLLLSNTESIHPSQDHIVAIPGMFTTANFLLEYAYPQLTQKKQISFDQIEDQLLNQQFDLGLVIHESRFTYQKKGLFKVKDLGAYWEEKEELPIPLGGIAIKRSLVEAVGCPLNECIKESIGWQNKQKGLSAYIQSHAQEMNPKIMQKHIDLYVNDFSEDVGSKGEQAISFMRDLLDPKFVQPIFISC